MTLGEAIDAYLAEARPDVTDSIRRRRARFRLRWIEWLGADRSIGSITVEELRTRREAMSDVFAPDTINMHFKFLKGVLALAIADGHLAGRNPAARMRKLATPPLSMEYLRDGDEPLLAEACDAELWDMILLAAHTGMRQGEQLRVRRSDVDVAAAVITLGRTKNGDTRIVHLNRIALRIVRRELSSHDGDWLYPARTMKSATGHLAPSTVARWWRQVREAAGLSPRLRWHDLRATCVTRMLDAGVSVEVVRVQIGHRTLAMVMRYSRVTDEALRDGVARLARRRRKNTQGYRHRTQHRP